MKFKIGDKVKVKSYKELMKLNDNESNLNFPFHLFLKKISEKYFTINDIDVKNSKFYFKEFNLEFLKKCGVKASSNSIYLYDNEVEKVNKINLKDELFEL